MQCAAASAPLCNLTLTGISSIQVLDRLTDNRFCRQFLGGGPCCPCGLNALPTNALVVDGGTSDDADDAVQWLKERPNWTAVGFEAAPERCVHARAVLKRFGTRAQLKCKALSDHVGFAHFGLENVQQGSLRESSEGVTVETTTLDHELSAHRLPIFLLKLDLQGGESKALQGAARLFRERRIFFVYVEFDPYLLDSAGSSAMELLGILHSYGMMCQNFRRRYWVPWLCNYVRADGNPACWTDLLCGQIPNGSMSTSWQKELTESWCKIQTSSLRSQVDLQRHNRRGTYGTAQYGHHASRPLNCSLVHGH